MYDYMPDCEPVSDVDERMEFDGTDEQWYDYLSLIRQCPVDEAEEFGIPRRRLRYAYQV